MFRPFRYNKVKYIGNVGKIQVGKSGKITF